MLRPLKPKKYYINYRGMIMVTKNKQNLLLLVCVGAMIAGSCTHVSGSDSAFGQEVVQASSNGSRRRISRTQDSLVRGQSPEIPAASHVASEGSFMAGYNALVRSPVAVVCGNEVDSRDGSSGSSSSSSDGALLAAVTRHLPNGIVVPSQAAQASPSVPLGGYVFPAADALPGVVPHDEHEAKASEKSSFERQYQAALNDQNLLGAHLQSQVALHVHSVASSGARHNSDCFSRGVQEPGAQHVSQSDEQAAPSESCWRRFLCCCCASKKQ